jgi:hypothetical protein
MNHQRYRLFAHFNGKQVEVECGGSSLAAAVQSRLAHLAPMPDSPADVVLRIDVNEIEPSWIEAHDSTGRCERGSFAHVIHHLRKWVISAFVTTHPELLWLHAAAATREGAAVLLAGPAGAGKSTLLVQLLAHSWSLVADDVAAVRVAGPEVLPLPFLPEVRTAPLVAAEDWDLFLEQPKSVAVVQAERVEPASAAIGAIVLLEYSVDASPFELSPLTAVSAIPLLAAQCLHSGHDLRRTLGELWCLARRVACYRLRYEDATAAAVHLTRDRLPCFTRR